MADDIMIPMIIGFAVGIGFVALALTIASPSLASGSEESNHIELSVEGLQSTYKTGEQIILSVNARGISDNACNIHSPRVSLESGDGQIIHWPNAYALYTSAGCPGPQQVDKAWTYGNDVETEFALAEPGSYTLIASLDDVTIEKSFNVTS